jgi:hypothetical protein
MAVVAGLGAVALLIGLNQAALAVLSGGFVFFLGGYHAALAFVKAAGLVH